MLQGSFCVSYGLKSIFGYSQIMPLGLGNGGPGKSWHPQDTREECVGVIRVRR